MEKITKIGENNVEVIEYLLDDKGKEVYLRDKTESYGQERVDQELTRDSKRLATWEKLDMEKYKQEKIQQLQKKVDKLQSIQTAMNTELT